MNIVQIILFELGQQCSKLTHFAIKSTHQLLSAERTELGLFLQNLGDASLSFVTSQSVYFICVCFSAHTPPK